VASLSVLLCIRWLDLGRLRDGIFFICTASLLWRVHLIFWPFYLVLAAYVVARAWRGDTPVGRGHAMLTLLILTCSLLPVLARAVVLLGQAKAHVIVGAPTIDDLLGSIKISFVTGLCAAGAVLLRPYLRQHGQSAVPGRSALILIVAWWLGPSLCLFAFSWITGNSVFVPRYLYLALPGVALAATAFIAPFIPMEKWTPLSCLMGIGVLLFVGHWNQLWPAHHGSDWKSAAAKVAQLGIDSSTPIICPSPFVEARAPVWSPTYPLPGFL
jgi:hypothetical protein